MRKLLSMLLVFCMVVSLAAPAVPVRAYAAEEDEETSVVEVDETGAPEEPEDTEPVETESAETESVETEPAETETAETEPVETEPAETEPAETEPVETEAEENEEIIDMFAFYANEPVILDGDTWYQDEQTILSADSICEVTGHGTLHLKAGSGNGGNAATWPAAFINETASEALNAMSGPKALDMTVKTISTKADARFNVYLNYENPGNAFFVGFNANGWYTNQYYSEGGQTEHDIFPTNDQGRIPAPEQGVPVKLHLEWEGTTLTKATVDGQSIIKNQTVDFSKPGVSNGPIAVGAMCWRNVISEFEVYDVKYYSAAVNHDVTYNLTNLTGNGAAQVREGSSLSFTLSANTGYALPEAISVTMGGADAAFTYDNATGAVTVENVTGEVVVTAAGVAQSHTHDGITFDKKLDGTATTWAPGNYYITGDHALDGSRWTINVKTGVVNLCLNGCNLSVLNGGSINIAPGATLNIFNCGDSTLSLSTGAFDIVGTLGLYGGSVVLNNDTFLNVTGNGMLCVDGANITPSGENTSEAAICVGGTGILNMHGGSINGAFCAVKVDGGNANIGGGTLTSNGVTVSVFDGTVYVSDGSIISNAHAGAFNPALYFNTTAGKLNLSGAPAFSSNCGYQIYLAAPDQMDADGYTGAKQVVYASRGYEWLPGDVVIHNATFEQFEVLLTDETVIERNGNLEVAEPHEHVFQNWTANADGKTHTGRCAQAGCPETRTEDHAWDEGVVADGTKTYTCTVCHATKTEQVGHIHDGGVTYDKVLTASMTTWEAGNYCLTGDVTMSGPVTVSGKVNLCLNGHTLTPVTASLTAGIHIGTGAALNVTDCTKTGKISGAAKDYSLIRVNGGTLDIADATVEGTGTSTTMLILLDKAGSTLNIHEGALIHGRTGFGTVVSANNGNINMDGGMVDTLSGTPLNKAIGTVKISGGKVDGKITANGGTLTISGTAYVRSGITATGTSTKTINVNGGEVMGLLDLANGTVNVNDGYVKGIKSGKAAKTYVKGGTVEVGSGHAINVQDGEVWVSGGTLKNNDANMANVYLANAKGMLHVSGGVFENPLGNNISTFTPAKIDAQGYNGAALKTKLDGPFMPGNVIAINVASADLFELTGSYASYSTRLNETNQLILVAPHTHAYTWSGNTATCTEPGIETGVCDCGDTTTRETAALGHAYGEPQWTWNADFTAAAAFTCANDATHIEVVNAEVTSETVGNVKTYTATVAFGGETYTDTAEETLAPAHTHDDIVFDKVLGNDLFAGEETQVELHEGNYILEEDVTMTKEMYIYGDVNICLNGHRLIALQYKTFTVAEEAVVSFYDCGEGALAVDMYRVNAGSKNIRGTLNLNEGVRVEMTKYQCFVISGTMNINGAELVTVGGTVGQFGIVQVKNGGTLNVNSGSITTDLYYAIELDGGTANIYDGTITSTMYRSGWPEKSGAISVCGNDTDAYLNIYGGTINADYVGIIMDYQSTKTPVSHVNFTGGEINANKWGIVIGGTSSASAGELNITGGKVTATDAVIRMSNANVTISGGELTTTGEAEPVIRLITQKVGSVHLTGSPVITGSLKNQIELFYPGQLDAEGYTGGTLGVGRYISSSSYSNYTWKNGDIIVKNTEWEKFTVDAADFAVVKVGMKNNDIVLGANPPVDTPAHAHEDGINFSELIDENTTELDYGCNYYLADDVVIEGTLTYNGGARGEVEPIHICLNGHTLKVGSFVVEGKSADTHVYVYSPEGTGKIVSDNQTVVTLHTGSYDSCLYLYDVTVASNFRGAAPAQVGAIECQGYENHLELHGNSQVIGNTYGVHMKDLANVFVSVYDNGVIRADYTGTETGVSYAVYKNAGSSVNVYGGKVYGIKALGDHKWSPYGGEVNIAGGEVLRVDENAGPGAIWVGKEEMNYGTRLNVSGAAKVTSNDYGIYVDAGNVAGDTTHGTNRTYAVMVEEGATVHGDLDGIRMAGCQSQASTVLVNGGTVTGGVNGIHIEGTTTKLNIALNNAVVTGGEYGVNMENVNNGMVDVRETEQLHLGGNTNITGGTADVLVTIPGRVSAQVAPYDNVTETADYTGKTVSIAPSTEDALVTGDIVVTNVTEGINDTKFTFTKELTLSGTNLVVAEEPISEKTLVLDANEVGSAKIWVDGDLYGEEDYEVKDGKYYIELPDTDRKIVTTYSYNSNDSDLHKVYPTGMKVWVLSHDGETYTATLINDLTNILQYNGASIRMTGEKGIRMITGIPTDKRQALIAGTLSDLTGYTLVEYGAVIGFVDTLDGNEESLTLGDPNALSNFAYGNGKDPIYGVDKGLTQYTIVMVKFDLKQCARDIAMRPYMKVQDTDGNIRVIYGGTVCRSIGYIAWQNKGTYEPESEGYNYIWEIINSVYGDNVPTT